MEVTIINDIVLEGIVVRRRCFWMSIQGIGRNTCDIGKDLGHTVTEVKIALPMSHNTLTTIEEHVK